jgi:N-acetylmuramoyl-L-alanine amidase
LKAPRFWRKADELPKLIRSTNKPLSNISIAIDPGHIGGEWAKMEGRWYQINNSGIEIKEGELTLEVAKKLKQKLEKLGAKVELVRSEKRPVNQLSPIDFISLAKEILKSKGMDSNEKNIKRESEILFYRSHEIRRRAFIVNKKIKPDIVICVHFNAESWGNPYSPILTKKNHLHLLINGNYSRSEFRLEDNRYHLFIRLFQGIHSEEFKISKAVAQSMAKETGLPPYKYKTSNAKLLDTNEPYIYTRNLLANRIYHCPVIFLEPYVMNNKEFYDRVKLGSYSGFKTINGKKRKSLMDEYTDGVVNGLKKYYIESRN